MLSPGATIAATLAPTCGGKRTRESSPRSKPSMSPSGLMRYRLTTPVVTLAVVAGCAAPGSKGGGGALPATGGGAASGGIGAFCAAHVTAPVMTAIKPADFSAMASAFMSGSGSVASGDSHTLQALCHARKPYRERVFG